MAIETGIYPRPRLDDALHCVEKIFKKSCQRYIEYPEWSSDIRYGCWWSLQNRHSVIAREHSDRSNPWGIVPRVNSFSWGAGIRHSGEGRNPGRTNPSL